MLVIGPFMAGPLLAEVGAAAADLVAAVLVVVALAISLGIIRLPLPTQEPDETGQILVDF